MSKYIKGRIIKGKITGIEKYGIFITFPDGYSGLIHISEISDGFVSNINSYGKIGEDIYSEILDVDDENKKIKLGLKKVVAYKGGGLKRKKIIETESGFYTLGKKLPYWIDDALKKSKNIVNTIDKQ